MMFFPSGRSQHFSDLHPSAQHSSAQHSFTHRFCPRWLLVGLPLAVMMATAGSAMDSPTTVSPGSAASPTDDSSHPSSSRSRGSASQASIAQLIEQLGDDSYATRTRATERLRQFGLEAFEQLRQAQLSPDLEVEMAARFLVSSLSVSWFKEDDPVAVQQALTDYGAQSEPERLSRIKRIAGLPGQTGIPALVRLARFETSARLSQEAAMQVMQKEITPRSIAAQSPRDRKLSEIIQAGLADSDRPSALWLQAYASDLASGKYSADDWDRLIGQHRHRVDAVIIGPSNHVHPIELVRTCAARAFAWNDKAQALKLANDHIDLVAPKTSSLLEASTWAIDHRLEEFVLSLRDQHPTRFSVNAELMYATASALLATGDQTAADSVARNALSIDALPERAEPDALRKGAQDTDTQGKDAQDTANANKLSPRQIQERAKRHNAIAEQLIRRGQFDWADRELRHVIDRSEVTSVVATWSRLSLARMYGDQLRHQEVVDTLTPILDRQKKDDAYARRLMENRISTNILRSQLEFHKSEALLKQQKSQLDEKLLKQAQDGLRLSLQLSGANVSGPDIDVLIRMYHLEGDQAWKDEVAQRLEKATASAERSVNNSRQLLRLAGEGALELGDRLNNYAWLVSNTTGDLKKALAFSLESIQLDPDAAKYDTCARCYYALKQFDKAIEWQEKALDIEPHSLQMQRQLDEFKAAWQKQQKESGKSESKAGKKEKQ